MLTSDKIDYLIEINKELAQRIRKFEQSEYQKYATKKEFSKISGVTLSDVEEKLMKDGKFHQACVRRFENSRTYYIHVDRALEYLERKLI